VPRVRNSASVNKRIGAYVVSFLVEFFQARNEQFGRVKIRERDRRFSRLSPIEVPAHCSREIASEFWQFFRELGNEPVHVSVSQDRDKGVVILSGQVATDDEKSQAESIAKSLAREQVVSDQIAVVPSSGASDAKAINSDLDKGIEKNLDAALIQNGFHKRVKYDVKNGVVTLTGEVTSQSQRAQAERVASSVTNVKQVVNELQVRNQKATSSK